MRKAQDLLSVPEGDKHSVEETSYLTSIPGMTKSIKQGMKEPLSCGAKKIDL